MLVSKTNAFPLGYTPGTVTYKENRTPTQRFSVFCSAIKLYKWKLFYKKNYKYENMQNQVFEL